MMEIKADMNAVRQTDKKGDKRRLLTHGETDRHTRRRVDKCQWCGLAQKSLFYS